MPRDRCQVYASKHALVDCNVIELMSPKKRRYRDWHTALKEYHFESLCHVIFCVLARVSQCSAASYPKPTGNVWIGQQLLCGYFASAARSVIGVASFQRKTLFGAVVLRVLIRDVTSNPCVECVLVDCTKRSLAHEVVALKLSCSMGMACMLNILSFPDIGDVRLLPYLCWRRRCNCRKCSAWHRSSCSA